MKTDNALVVVGSCWYLLTHFCCIRFTICCYRFWQVCYCSCWLICCCRCWNICCCRCWRTMQGPDVRLNSTGEQPPVPILSTSGDIKLWWWWWCCDGAGDAWDFPNICLHREVFENTYQGQPSLLVVMEWWESSSSLTFVCYNMTSGHWPQWLWQVLIVFSFATSNFDFQQFGYFWLRYCFWQHFQNV